MATVNNFTTLDFKEKDCFFWEGFCNVGSKAEGYPRRQGTLGHVIGQAAKPIPVDPTHPTAAETREMNTWDKDDRKVRSILMQALTT